MTKYCVDCKHFHVPPGHNPESALCRAIEGSRSLVTGLMVYPHQFASAHRINGCGQEATLFEPKESNHE
jgi:hypothetical protein